VVGWQISRVGRRAATFFHRDTQPKPLKNLVLREPQVAPDCCRKLATKGVKDVDAHLLTDPPVGEMGHGTWPRLHGRGYFSRKAKTNSYDVRPQACASIFQTPSRSNVYARVPARTMDWSLIIIVRVPAMTAICGGVLDIPEAHLVGQVFLGYTKGAGNVARFKAASIARLHPSVGRRRLAALGLERGGAPSGPPAARRNLKRNHGSA
jgi:hypothetical protein